VSFHSCYRSPCPRLHDAGMFHARCCFVFPPQFVMCCSQSSSTAADEKVSLWRKWVKTIRSSPQGCCKVRQR